MEKKGGYFCAAKHCKNRQFRSKTSFFGFPKDINRARTWAVACGREDLLQKLENLHKSYKLCGAHFEESCFLNDLRNRLKPNVVPTIFPSLEGTSRDHNYSVVSYFGTDLQIPPDHSPTSTSEKHTDKRKLVTGENVTEVADNQNDENMEPEEEPPRKIQILQNIAIIPGTENH